jgi:hypothetical protein
MTDAYQGTAVTLTVSFFASPGGPPADVTGLNLTLTDPSAAVVLDAVTDGIEHVATGVYRYTWVVPIDAELGDWLALWEADGPITANELVTVHETVVNCWASTTDVYNVTGVQVTAPQLQRAHWVLRSFVPIDPADPGEHFRATDRLKLFRAECFQAAWMFEQIDVSTRTDVSQLSQDGLTFTYANPDAVVLAPLAKRNVDRLTFNASRNYGGSRRPRRYADIEAVADAVMRDEAVVPDFPWRREGSL